MATGEDLVAAGSSNLAPPPVMLAPSPQMKKQRNMNTQIPVSQKAGNFYDKKTQNWESSIVWTIERVKLKYP